MPDEGPLEHYLTVSHEPEPDISEPAPERSPGPWRERGIMLGLGFLLGCIGAYALVYSEMSGGMRSLKQSLSEERDLNASLQKERAHLRETLEQARMDALLEERSPLSVTVGGVPRTSRRPFPSLRRLRHYPPEGWHPRLPRRFPVLWMTVWSIRGRRTGRSVTSTPL